MEFDVPDGAPEPGGMAPVEPADGPPDPDETEPAAGAEPDEPEVTFDPVFGTIAGDPEVVEFVPVAVGRSDDGSESEDCARAGVAITVATRQATQGIFSMERLPAVIDHCA